MHTGQRLRMQIFGKKPGTAVITTHFKTNVFDFDFQPSPTGGADLNIVRCTHNPLPNTPGFLFRVELLFLEIPQ